MKKSLAMLIATIVVGACGAQSPTPTAPPATTDSPASQSIPTPMSGDDTAPITVWYDTTRQPALEAFKKAFPEKANLINAELVDLNEIPAKIILANNAGKGWPDVVFNGAYLIARTATPKVDWALDLRPYIEDPVLKGFDPASVAECTLPDGRLICFPNDLGQTLTFYNKPLMDQFGYEIPETWEAWAALGERLAVEHPGYVIGAFGDNLGLDQYFWPSRCPTGRPTGVDRVYINALAPECIRIAQWLDKLIGLGVVSKVGSFDPAFVKLATENKLLLLNAENWYGEYVFGGKPDSLYYTTAEGQLGVATPPRWEADSQPYFGGGGGAAWAVSKHTANPSLATDFARWVSTADEYQATIAPTYPAYRPAAETWVKSVAGNEMYANDPGPVMTEAAALTDPLWGVVRYDTPSVFVAAVIAALNEGRSVESALPAFQEQLVQAAEAQGYQVSTQP